MSINSVGGCENYGPLLDPYYNTAPNIYGTPMTVAHLGVKP